MDFENMKRKELQALCKEHGIPANLTNLEMANKLSSLLKVNDEKPLTRGRSCLKIFDENVNDRESDVVNRKIKKVKFSPDNEIIEFTRSAQVKRGGRQKSMLYKNNLNVGSDGVKVGILDSPVRVTRSQRVNMEDGVTEKKERTRHVKDSLVSVNESKDEVGVTTRSLRNKEVVTQEKREENKGMNMEDGITKKKGRTKHVKDSLVSVNESKDELGVTTRSLRNKEVVIQEKREENEGATDGLRMSRRVRSRKNAKGSAGDSQEELKMEELDNSKSEKEIDRAEKRDKKVTFISGGQMNECTQSETKAKETERERRRKSMALNQTLHVQNEVHAEVREEVAEKPARVTRSRNSKPVDDNVSNKKKRTRGKEAIETSEKLLCSKFVESSVEAVKDEVRVNTRRSKQNSVVEAPPKALNRSGRVANKAKGASLTDDISKENMVTGVRTRNQSNLIVEASTLESGAKIVEPKGKLEAVPQLEELVEVPLRRSDRRKSVFPLENLRGDEVAAKKEKRNFLNSNNDEPRNKGTKEEPLKRSKRLATQVEDSVLAKDDSAESEVVDRGRTARNQSTLERRLSSSETSSETDKPTESQGTLEVVLQTIEVPVRSNRRKSVVPSLEKVRSDEVAVIKEKRNLNANDDEIRSKGTKEEPQKASKRSKRLAKQMEDPVLAKGDIAENKLEERRCSRRNAAKANVDTKILDRSVHEETSVVKEERRCSGRSAARHTLAAISDDKKVEGENKLTNRNCTVIQEKDSTNKCTLQDLDSLKQSSSSSKESIQAAVVKKTSTAGKKQQGRLKRSNVEVEVPMPEDIEIVGEADNKDFNISGSACTMSFSRSSLNELEAVPDDVNIVLAGTKNDTAAELSTLADKLNEEGPFVDANSSPSENHSASKSLPFSDPFNSDARPEENLVEELLKSDHKAHASKGLCPSSVLADDAHPNDLTSDKQEPGAIAADNAEEFDTGVSNEGLDNCSLSQSDNMEENLDSGTKDEAAAELSTLADKLNEEGPLVDANASLSENNSTSKCLPLSDPFNSNARPEENLVEELLASDQEEPTSQGLYPSSVLADDAVPTDITSDKQEPGAIAADNAEEFVTGLSNEVLDNCLLSNSDNTAENLDSGIKDEAAPESSTLADKLIEEGPLIDTNGSPSENNSTSKYLPFSDSFNFNAKPEENLVEELLQSDHEVPTSKALCPSSVLADDAVPNEITSEKQEIVSIVADNAEEFVTGLSIEVLDNCSLNQSVNVEESLDSGFKEQMETGCIVTEGITYGEQEPASKSLCLSSALADDAFPNDITSDKQEHGAVAAEEFDTRSYNEVLENCSVKRSDNMEQNLDAGFKEQSETGSIVIEAVTYGEQEPESKGLCPNSVLADDAVVNDMTSDKLEHGAIAADNAEEFETGPSNEVIDNCSVNQSDNRQETLDSGFKEQSEAQCIVTVGVNYGEHELTVTDSAKKFDVGLSCHVSLDAVGAFNQSNEMEVKNSESDALEQAEAESGPMEQDEAESGPKEQAEAESGPMEQAEAESGRMEQAEAESGPMEQAEVESDPEEAKYDLDAPTFTCQGEIHAEEYADLEAVSSEKTLSSPIKAVQDLQETGILGDGITLHLTPLEDSDEEKQGEELKILFATPCYVSHSKEEKKASLDGNSREESLNREGQVSPISDSYTSSLQSSVRDCGEHDQGENLKNLFATPCGSKSSKVEISTCIVINETSSQYKHSCHENENTASSAGNGLTQSVAPLKDSSKDEAGEELKGLFATPSVVSQSVGGQHCLFQSQLSGEAMTMGEELGSSGRENLNESVRGLTEDTRGMSIDAMEHIRTLFASPVSVKCTSQETTSTKGKYSQSHETETYICGEMERNLGESEAGSVGVDQAPETSLITALNYGDENEQEDQLKVLFASPIITRPLDQMDGTSRKTEDKKNLLSGNVQGLSHNKIFPVAHPSAIDLEEPESTDSKRSQEQIKVEKIKETAECMKESSALEEENNEGQSNMLSATSAKSMTPLRNDEFSSQEPKIKETAECTKESRALEEDIYVGIANKSTSFVSEPTSDDIEFCEQQMVSEINKSSLEFNEATEDHLKLLFATPIRETSPSRFESLKPSDAYNEESMENHLKLLFATPIKGTSPSRLGEASSSQLKTVMIAMASEMVGQEPKHKGSELSGEPLTVGIINGGSDSTKRSCFSKEIEQFKGGPLFPTPSKCTSPLQLEGSPGCEEDIFKDLDGVKFLNSQEQNFAQHEDRQLLNEMTDDTGEATLHWFQTNGGSLPRQTDLETQKENDSAHPFDPLHEKGDVTEDDALAEGKEDDHLVAAQESLGDRLGTADDAAKGGAVSDAVCQQPNILLTEIETEVITQESIRNTDDISVSAESGILEFDAESTALRSQETIINTVEQTKGDEVQKIEVTTICNASLQNVSNDDEYAKEISTDLPADEQFHFPEHCVIENVLSTEEFTASTNECQHVSKEDDLAAERNGLVIIESNESTSMNVNDSGLTTQMDLPGIFAGESGSKIHSALSEEPQNESDQGKSNAAKQQDEDSFDKKEQESTEAVLSSSFKSPENNSFIEEGFAGEDTLMSEKKNDLAEKKVPLTPAGVVAKTSFAKHLNTTVKKKNARSILIHGTPNKLTQIADMKENAPSVKGDIGTLTALRPEKRLALKDLTRK
ncbi:hypothetical protein HAX54_043883 [Datura stramonium]|uniref:Uncharacterized protein n=1 Tax=Datura stramonium TaxID=4076 RepID=A0ABS8SP26_DATST|nr:hypothetical protein [Datura stramonium]